MVLIDSYTSCREADFAAACILLGEKSNGATALCGEIIAALVLAFSFRRNPTEKR
jgi:hypothetical protein